jgi:hypothetical protein
MARLTLARKIAAITLHVWKKGEAFDAEYLSHKPLERAGPQGKTEFYSAFFCSGCELGFEGKYPGRVRLCAPLAPSLTGHHMLPRITQQSHSAAPRRESQIEPWLAKGHRQACAASASEGCRNAEMKTVRQPRISALQHDHRGWMPENYLAFSGGRSIFS